MPGPYIGARRALLRTPTVTVAASAKSIVLAAASSQYLTRTWGSAPTDDKKATIAFFVKYSSDPSANRYFYDGGANTPIFSWLQINGFDTDRIQHLYNDASVITKADGSFSDTTIWHHVTVSYDTTQATEANRTKIYLDGTEVSYAIQNSPAQNASLHLTDNGVQSFIGDVFFGGGATTLDAKLAYFYLIDGQALTPSSFTTGTGAGTTIPAAYGGSFGTNGFFLNFNDNTNDQSGNGNNWTQNGSPTFSTDLPS